MINDRTKVLCLIAITLTASGCSDSGAMGDADISDPQLPLSVPLDTDSTNTLEVTGSNGTSDSIATAVPSVSSGQMDAFISNPLVTVIPDELKVGTSNAYPGNFITNPLVH